MAEEINGHEGEEEDFGELEVVEFEDENGTQYTAAILAVIEIEDNDYAVLAPVEQLNDDSEGEMEIFLFQYHELDDGTEQFSYIEDERIFEMVRAEAAELLEAPEEE